MNRLLRIIKMISKSKNYFIVFMLLCIIASSFRPTLVLAEGNPFVVTTDTMGTGLTAQVGSGTLVTASQNIANFTDVTGAYYDSTLNRIVFIGKTDGTGPKYNKDDMAVAIQSIIFNGTMPNVNIGDDPNNPSGSTALVTYSGSIQNTSLGSTLFNSDYKLKQYVIGYDPSNTKITSTVPTYKSVVDRYIALNPNPVVGNQTKFILSPQGATLKNATSEKAFVFNTLSMQTTVQHTNPGNDPRWNQAASDFANDITTNYEQFAQETPSLSQAKQIAKVVAILKWVTDNNISTDFQWAQNYTPQSVSTPTTVQKVTTPVLPNGYSAQGEVNFNTPNAYVPDDGTAASLKSASQAVSTAKEDITWTFTNGGQQYQAVAVAADAFESLGGYNTSIVDMGMPVAGDLNLALQRTYSSFDNGQSGIGIGWEMLPGRLYPNSTLQDLDITTCNDILFFKKLAIDTPFGHETFTFNCPSGYAPDDPSFHSKLIQNPDETLTVILSDQTKYKFSTDLQLVSIFDKNSNTINYSYDGTGKLTSIADTKVHQLTLAYNGQNLVSSVTDWANRKVEYSYDSSGKLTGVKDPNGNTTIYGYDGNSRLTTVTDRTGQTVLTNTYGSDAKITTQKNAANITKTNAYDTANKLITQTDTNGRVVKITYDSKARILQQTDPAGKSNIYTYGIEAVPLTQKDKNGNTTTFVYDSRGNVTSVTFPDNSNITYTFDSNNRITKVIDGRYGIPAKETNYTYDSSGNQTQKDEAGSLTKYTYEATGEPLTLTDPLNHVTTWTRDTLGNILTEKDSYNSTTTFTYDSLGRLTQHKDPTTKIISHTYDTNGNLLTKTDGAGTTSFIYDKENKLTKTTLPGNIITQYAYNSSNSLSSALDPLSNTTTYGYDSYQNLTIQKDALNNTTTNIYDSLNRQTQSTTPLGKVSKWEYDAIGNITKRIDANNNATTYLYDSLNHLKKITYPDTKTVTFEYDARGNRTKVIDSVGTSTFVYDKFDRLIQATNVYGHVIKYEYDNADNMTKLTYPDNTIATYVYDNNNRMISAKDWNNNTTTYTYNTNGTLSKRTLPNTITTTYTYDSSNRLSGIIHKKSTTTLAKYDYMRDPTSNIKVATESGSFVGTTKTTKFIYDVVGRLTNATYPSSNTYTYTYDKVGNRLTQQAVNDYNEDDFTRAYTYDADNRLTKINTYTNFTYDNNGNMTQKPSENSNPSPTYMYDFENRMIQHKTAVAENIWNYTYDGLGNRLQRLGSTANERYVTDMSGELSRTVAIASGQGSSTIIKKFFYGIGLISDDGSTYHLEDGMGNVRFMSSSTGGNSGSVSYDPFGRLRSFSEINSFEFQQQWYDYESELYFLRVRYYDPSLGRFTSRDPYAGSIQNPLSQNPYIYAHDNPINLSDPSGRCIAYLCVPEAIVIGTLANGAAPALTSITASIGQDIKNGEYLSAVDKASWFVPGASVEKLGFKFSSHALKRLAQRGITGKLVYNLMRNTKPFTYYHEGLYKTGYYDRTTNLFVGVYGNEIKTIFYPSQGIKYIQNLQKAKP